MIQRYRTLYRQNNYGIQNMKNSNPDNFWDGRFFCWTSDPTCGLDIGPKRPWEDLKDPKANLAKLNRDASVNSRREQVGYGGFWSNKVKEFQWAITHTHHAHI